MEIAGLLAEQCRLNGAGSEREARLLSRIAELEKALRAKHACCCRSCADEIERLLPDTKID